MYIFRTSLVILHICLFLVVHLASPKFINSKLRAPLSGVVPNQLRVYREYPVILRHDNKEQSEALDEEEQKILVNCTITTTDDEDEETDKAITTTTANCTITRNCGLERNDEQNRNKIKQEIPEVVDDSTVQYRRAGNLKPQINISDDAYVNVNKQSESETTESIKEVDQDKNESETLLPVILEWLSSSAHPQVVSDIGERNSKSDEEKFETTSEATLLRSSGQERIIPDKVDEPNDYAGTLKDTVQNVNEESLLTSRYSNNESTLTQHVNEPTQQNFKNLEQTSIDDDIIASSYNIDESERNALGVNSNPMATKFPNNNMQTSRNTENSVVSDTDNNQRFIIENIPNPFNRQYQPNNNHDYTFDNSGRLIEIQTPNKVDYKASTANEEPLQRQPEHTINQPSLVGRYANKRPLEQLSSKTVIDSTEALVKNELLNNPDPTSATENSFEQYQAVNDEFTEQRFQNAKDSEDGLPFARTIGSSQEVSSSDPEQRQRTEDLQFSNLKVSGSRITAIPLGNEYPITVQVYSNTIDPAMPSQMYRRMNYMDTNALANFGQDLDLRTPSFLEVSGRQQAQRYAKMNPHRHFYDQLTPFGNLWDFSDVPRETIWDSLRAATNKARNWNNHA